MNKFIAIGRNIILKPIREEKTDTGIILTSNNKTINFNKGEVLSVGEEVKDPIHIGDTVVINKDRKRIVKVDDDEVVFIDYNDIFCKIGSDKL